MKRVLVATLAGSKPATMARARAWIGSGKAASSGSSTCTPPARAHRVLLGRGEAERGAAVGGVEQHQAGGQRRVAERDPHRAAGAERHAADHRAGEPEVASERRDIVGEVVPGQRAGVNRSTAAAQVGGDQPEPRRQRGGEQAAGQVVGQAAVQQDDRRTEAALDGEQRDAVALEPEVAGRVRVVGQIVAHRGLLSWRGHAPATRPAPKTTAPTQDGSAPKRSAPAGEGWRFIE
ncbi:MAG TPA: hypothetical protein VM734_27220 [Kofleriaceae bacterium]|nr:hypothetical protein [Kofleriaceae bacterium]